jgi:predicted ester cyclase
MISYFRSGVMGLLALALLIVPVRGVAAQDATPEAECVTTTPEENLAIADAYWQEAVWGEQGKIKEVVAPDEVHHWGIAGTTTGIDGFMERWALFNTAFPDLKFTVDLAAADGDLVANYWTATGTQEGEWQGIAPTDQKVTWNGVNIFRIACGMISESWGEANHLGLLAQLGASDIPTALIDMSADSAATPMAAAAATPCAEDNPETNLAVAQRWTDEVWTQQALDVLDEIAAPEIVHDGGVFPAAHGPEAVKAGVGGVLATYPDIQIGIDDAFAADDLVVVGWSGSGTHEGDFLGIAATGKEIPLTGINVYRIHCGQIVESWSETNGLAMLRMIQESQETAATPVA